MSNFQSDQHDDVKEWVLAVSVDKEVDRVLLTDKRGVYEASLQNPDGSTAESCIVTGMRHIQDNFCLTDFVRYFSGYPISNTNNKKVFGDSNKAANKEDWNKLLMMTKVRALNASSVSLMR